MYLQFFLPSYTMGLLFLLEKFINKWTISDFVQMGWRSIISHLYKGTHLGKTRLSWLNPCKINLSYFSAVGPSALRTVCSLNPLLLQTIWEIVKTVSPNIDYFCSKSLLQLMNHFISPTVFISSNPMTTSSRGTSWPAVEASLQFLTPLPELTILDCWLSCLASHL